MKVPVRSEAHWDEETAAVYTGVQGEGRPGRAHRAQSPAEACRKHILSPNLLGLWKATFLERAHTLFQPDEQRDEDQARIAELEQLLGRATRQIEILKKASTLLDAASTRNGR